MFNFTVKLGLKISFLISLNINWHELAYVFAVMVLGCLNIRTMCSCPS